MSSTRRAKDQSVFHQSRFASSPEFERGLIANLVAKRCTALDSKSDRELIWFIQYLSHQAGGLTAIAADIIAKFPQCLGTCGMVASGKTAGDYSADEVRIIRREMPADFRSEFPLRDEINKEITSRFNYAALRADHARLYLANSNDCYGTAQQARKDIENEKEAADALAGAKSASLNHPKTHPVQTFFDVCRQAAIEGGTLSYGSNFLSLEKELARMCLDPACDLTAGPWYFSNLVKVLREYQQIWIEEKSRWPITAVGRIVCDTLDYSLETGVLSLMIGSISLGQSFAARAWCEQHVGQARMVDVPPSNDEASFYRAIAEAVGLGNYLNYKNVQIKERVEFVLREGGIFLVLNHAERLWPQKNLREAFPGRLAWLLDQVANGAAVCLISGPQFFMQQRACEKTGWNSPELQMQIANTVQLPASLSVEDVTAIARIALPGLTEKFLSAVAVVAVSSKRYLASIEAIVKRAQYIAKQNGRQQCDTKDITAAISFVNQSDNLLRNLLSGTQKIAPTRPITAEPPATTHSRLPERESNPAGLVPTPAVNRRSDSDAETSSSCKRNSIDLIKG